MNIDENNPLLDVGSVTFLLEILNQHSLHVHLLFSLIEHYALVIFWLWLNVDSKFSKEMLRCQHPIIDYFHLCSCFKTPGASARDQRARTSMGTILAWKICVKLPHQKKPKIRKKNQKNQKIRKKNKKNVKNKKSKKQ